MPSLVDSLVSHKEDETLTTGEGASTGNRDGESSQFLAGVDGYSQSICSLWNTIIKRFTTCVHLPATLALNTQAELSLSLCW